LLIEFKTKLFTDSLNTLPDNQKVIE